MVAFLRFLLCYLIICLPCSFLFGQKRDAYIFKHISTESGLSNSTIECIFQDHSGLIWIGTRNGLNRIEGDHITTFYHDNQDSGTISNDYITDITEDNQHHLWLGTRNGINKLDLHKGSFHSVNIPNASLPLIVNKIACDSSGYIWVATANSGLFKINPANNKAPSITNLVSPTWNKSNTVNTLYIDKYQNIWFSTPSGLYSYGTQTNNWKQWLDNSRLQDCNIIKILSADDHTLILGTEKNGLLIFNHRNNVLQKIDQYGTDHFRVSNNMIKSLWKDNDGTIWIGTLTGLDHLNYPADSITHLYSEQDNEYALSQKTISSIFRDKESNLWVGTHRGGLNISYAKLSFFKTFRLSPKNGALHYEDIKTFWEAPNGKIWTGTDGGGINILDPVTGLFSYLKHDSSNHTSISSNAILDIYADRSDNLWLATWGGGLNKYLPGAHTFIHYRHRETDATSIPSDYVQRIYQDKEGLLWVCTYFGGLALLDPQTGKFTPFDQSGISMDKLSGRNILSIIEDNYQRLWVGTDDGGLNCIDKKNRTIQHYFIDKNTSIPDLRVLFIDNQSRLWVGEKGLFRFDPQKNKFVAYKTGSLLDNVIIKSIEQDSKGLLWISTSNGLFSLNLQTNNVQRFNNKDDLQGEEFEDNASLKSRTGIMYFGGLKGFNSFHPELLMRQLKSPKLLFTGLTILDNPHSPMNRVLLLPDAITLSYLENSFTIQCANAIYSDIGNHNIVYRLKGISNNWQEAVGNKISFNHLAPGSYQLEICSNASDMSNPIDSKTITIIITPPFWQNNWFIALIILLLGGLIFWLMSIKRKKELKQLREQNEKEITEMQVQMFTNISHELRTPLTMISVPIETLMNEDTNSKNQKTYRSIYANTQKLQQLLKEILDFSKLKKEDTPLRVSKGNMVQLGSEVTDAYQFLASQKGIKLHYNSDTENFETYYDHSIVEKIMNNLLSNAIKYTGNGGQVHFTIHFTGVSPKPYFKYIDTIGMPPRSPLICILVRDNGIGITEGSLPNIFHRYFRTNDRHIGAGIGLAFVKHLVLKHKGSIIVSSEKGKGTEFMILLPSALNAFNQQELTHENIAAFTNLEEPGADYNYNEHQKEKAHKNAPTILIVEDNQEVQHLIENLLDKDYNIQLASNGQDALQLITNNMPQLIISDIMMPVMDGIEFCKSVRSDNLTAHIPIILLTAKESDQSYLEGIETGADYYFIKPFKPNILKKTIERIFQKRAQWKSHLLQEAHLSVLEITQSQSDKALLQNLIDIIESNIQNADFKVDDLCKEISMSKTKLYLKIKEITGGSYIELVKDLKMKKAATLLTTTSYSISEIMDMVGIQSQSYFSKTFKSTFGKSPSAYFQGK